MSTQYTGEHPEQVCVFACWKHTFIMNCLTKHVDAGYSSCIPPLLCSGSFCKRVNSCGGNCVYECHL